MAKKLLHTTSAEPIEVEELSGRVLRIIDAYGMGTALDTRDPNVGTAPIAGPPEPVLVPASGDMREGMSHVLR
jgi:hypothetical protein